MSRILRILHLTSWLTSKGGGIPPVIKALAREYLNRGLACQVAGLTDGSCARSTPADHGDVSCGRIVGPASFGFSPELRSALVAHVGRDSVIHVHGLWMYPGVLGRRLSRRFGAKRIVSPHGMLEPWALQNSRWKKRLAGWLFEACNLRTADCLHALCQTEADNIRHYGLQNPIAVISNGVDASAFQNLPRRGVLEARFPALRGRRWILFLSRIHPKKGLPHLLRAWASVQHSQLSTLNSQHSDWLLIIAGPDELGHEAEVKRLVTELGLENSVLFTGPLQGGEKLAALGGAELFVLPSFSEGFSMAVLEAAAAGLPILLTPQCNFSELVSVGGAVEVLPNADSCTAGLRKLLSLSDPELKRMGERARKLVGASYSWSKVADQMLALYRWLADGGAPPACVRLN
jgi:glycosyltransferase involved in cell wall biosynthesis